MKVKSFIQRASPRAYERISVLADRGYYSRGVSDAKVIFIHIPKTGGTSIGTLVPGKSKGHATIHEYRRADPAKFDAFFKFSFVRNPWDRVASAYWFLDQSGKPDVKEADNHCEAGERAFAFGATTSFEQFVEERLAHCLAEPHFRPQHEFICENGENLMDFTGRYESFEADFSVVRDRLGLTTPLPRLNRSPRDDDNSKFSPAMRNIVGELYEEDIRQFGY